MAITSFTRMSELVKETGLRSVGASRMGSNPIPSNEFGASFQKAPGDHMIRLSLLVKEHIKASLKPSDVV